MTTFIRTNGYGLNPRALLADPFVTHLFGDARAAAPEIRLDVEETTDVFMQAFELPPDTRP